MPSQVTLLGTDGARKKEIKKKGPMLLPLLVNEEESNQLLADLLNAGRLSPAAHDLLVRRLLPYDPHERFVLGRAHGVWRMRWTT